MENLASKVNAVNRANAYAMEIEPQLKAIFAPFVGEKVLKIDGSLMAKFEKLVPKFPNSPALQVIFHRSAYSLAWTVRTCEPTPPHGCCYHETTVYVADLRDGVIGKLYDAMSGLRTDYNVDEILRLRKVAVEAEKAYREAKNALYPFGE